MQAVTELFWVIPAYLVEIQIYLKVNDLKRFLASRKQSLRKVLQGQHGKLTQLWSRGTWLRLEPTAGFHCIDLIVLAFQL